MLIDIAIPLGLILNELLTNSYKYAFNDNNIAAINIKLQETEKNDITKRVVLLYKDSGKGYNFSIEKPTTLGLRLIHVLSKQIGATIDYNNSNGSQYKFSFGLNI